MRLLSYILLAVTVYLALFYLENYQPEMMTRMLIQVDVFGLTRVAENEQERLTQIKNLTIPYAEKQVLMNCTVFMGASEEMVRLALGGPRKVVEGSWNEKPLIYYIYYLPDDKRPTVLIFQDDKLINAYKGSALDVGN